MYKKLFLLVVTCLVLTATRLTAGVAAVPLHSVAARWAVVPTHRPSYKRYGGNSRHKVRKLTMLKRWKLRRKALSKKQMRSAGRPHIQAGPPVRRR